ncbi:MAG: Asp-tRNA(Asn)/Glu-tRNA(Gln) amidotransferase subunit GatB [Armatimonadetes bacterium]|nr:Asp-tRNA(Asn)/Glu-tRNA(Gln) amidotransferase subunit GatB [Armatimonadota bacterium]
MPGTQVETRYVGSIGMEVHAELLTESKMFCGCRNAFGGEPNTRCCPVCLGLPGSLPVANRLAVELVVRAALALNCAISPIAKFDRKNYFYPDLPKGYQISQYDQPIGSGGWLDIESEAGPRRVHIRRVHLEEDTGKLMHLPTGDSAVDYNRSGVPLMEIVTEFPPDMSSADEARAYLVKLRAILTCIGVSDGKMEQGSLRCEPNISVRPEGSAAFGTKTEIKNLNSFRAVHRGVQHELARQVALLRRGDRVAQETRGWNEARGETVLQRVKEVEQEYRYFPEPDLMPVHIDDARVGLIRARLPELPDAARVRLVDQYGLSPAEADLLTQTAAWTAYFERAAGLCGNARATANWMMGELARLLNAANLEIEQCKAGPEALADLLAMVENGRISGKMAKGVWEAAFETGEAPAAIAARQGEQISDADALGAVLDSVIAAQPDVWQALCAGDEKKLTFMVGQIMKQTRGKANPGEVNRLLRERMAGGAQ